MQPSQQSVETRPVPPGQASERVRLHRRIEGLIADWDTTPGKLRLARIILVIGVLLAGSVGFYAANARMDTMRDIAEHLEPLNAHVTTLYRSLADADTTVATGFLSGRVEPRHVRARYDGDVDLAMTSLAQASIQAGRESIITDQIINITKQLPVYTGLVEQARANNRQGLTVGVAYLRLASDLMQNRILPQAAELQRRQATRLDDAYLRAGSVPLVALVAGGMSLAVLILAQIFLFRRTHRVVNIGLAAASTAVLIGLLWWTVATAASTGPLTRSHQHSQSVSDALGPAQITALQARTVESLGLARTGTTTEADFDARMQWLARNGGALDAARALTTDQTGRDLVDAAAKEALNYSSAHQKVRQLDDSAQYAEAVKAAVSIQETSAATAFDQLDKALIRAVDHERRALGSDIDQAQRHLTGLPTATGALALAAAIGVALGIRQRLEEYR
ncbi:MAG: hypothetical protein ACRDTA_13915 [Pseudonocardiaceae bacterium]